jgi:RNA polymerase sigma factor (sigma-70 family)
VTHLSWVPLLEQEGAPEVGFLHCRRSDDQLDELIEEAQADPRNDSPAMSEIVRRFDGLAKKEARRLTSDDHLRGDLANCARVELIKAVRRHDPSRQGFPSYVRICMRGAAHRALRSSKSWGRGDPNVKVAVTDFSDPESEPLVPRIIPETETSVWGDGQTAKAVATLSPTQRDLLEMRYVSDRTLSEISQTTGTTVSAVRQRLETAQRNVTLHLAA